jgi:2'-5' RNA ligase
MDSCSNGAASAAPVEERLNVFALVIYIPDPLGEFLDDLRRELAPHYNPHAHVSVLPPRPLAVDWRKASDQLRAVAETWSPFDVELTTLGVFRVTDVIYLEVGKGATELRQMHESTNREVLAFQEPFEYHPHITLAQDVAHQDVGEVFELARHRWEEFQGIRSFRAERAVFVQNTIGNVWLDLADLPLGSLAMR